MCHYTNNVPLYKQCAKLHKQWLTRLTMIKQQTSIIQTMVGKHSLLELLPTQNVL